MWLSRIAVSPRRGESAFRSSAISVSSANWEARTMRDLENFARSWSAGSFLFSTMWPQCPASIDQDGTGLFVDRANAILTEEEPMRTVEQRPGIWRLSLEQIEATVADHLGSGRVSGNQAAPCLSRQVSMYLAKNVAGWSTTRIGRFYNGRHHTTVLHSIEKIERLRQADESLDALLEVITAELSLGMEGSFTRTVWRHRVDHRVG